MDVTSSYHSQERNMDDLISLQDMISALQFQVDWGVEEIIEDSPTDFFVQRERAETQRQNSQQSNGRELTASAVSQEQRVRGHANKEDNEKVSHKKRDRRDEIFLQEAQNFEEILERASKLEDFAPPRYATNPVRPSFVAGAKLLIIGETPSDEEDRSGRVFEGREGQILTEILSSLGIKKEEISLCAAFPWRIPGIYSGQALPSYLFERARVILEAIICEAQPHYILSLGQNPLNLLLGQKVSLRQNRGKIHHLTIRGVENPVFLIASYGLTQVQNTAAIRQSFWRDMIILAENMGF